MKKTIIAAIALLIFAGCYNDKYNNLYPSVSTATCDTATITYSADIEPIIAGNCYDPGNGCHDATGSSVSGYNYQTSISALQDNALNGTLLIALNWIQTKGIVNMPLNGTQLSSCDINKITRWVNEGAPNN